MADQANPSNFAKFSATDRSLCGNIPLIDALLRLGLRRKASVIADAAAPERPMAVRIAALVIWQQTASGFRFDASPR
jgi:hypothetical protein